MVNLIYFYWLGAFIFGLILMTGLIRRIFFQWNIWAQFLFALSVWAGGSYLLYFSFLIYYSKEPLSKILITSIAIATIISLIFFLLEIFTILNVMMRRNRRSLPEFLSKSDPSYTPMVSIHIPTCSEPPEVIKTTLNFLKKLDYPFFEVLVIDNNTPLEKLWKPIEDHCQKLGPKFKFFHIDKLPGAKAGALNFALTKTHPHAEIICVIDADYQAKPDFLKELVPYFKNPKLALIQTPQDYRDFSYNRYLENCFWEYRYFFSFIMPSCHEYNAASFMGTMGLIRKKVLTSIRKWSEWCITEDTELGIRIHQNKLSTIYLDKSFGQGLMPFEFRDYKKQRRRWVFGNMQIIRRNLCSLLSFSGSKLNLYQKISYLSQLAVWFNNLFLVSLILIGLAILKLFWVKINPYIIVGAGLPLFIFLFSKSIIFFFGLRKREKISFSKSFGALFSHLSLTWPMATAWLACLFSPRGSFWRTSKYPHQLRTIDKIQTVKWEFCFFLISFFLATSLLFDKEFLLSLFLFAQALFIYLPALVAVVKYK